MKLRRAPDGAAAEAFVAAGRPSDGVGWRDASWCAVDLEMTGLDPRSDEIISVGAVPIEEGRIVLGRARYTLVRASKRSRAAPWPTARRPDSTPTRCWRPTGRAGPASISAAPP